jgi:ubiquinone/menaquinone biosynthesis C-methylase UbiE
LTDWDAEAASFDAEPDHGLIDPAVREAWRQLLARVLPPPPARVLDVGCGTGTLAVLVGSLGYDVTGVDSSSEMLSLARAKASERGTAVTFLLGDAACPPVTGPFDVVLCRHVLWALPSPEHALASWRELLSPGGRLLLIEGLWSTGAGLAAAELQPLVEGAFGSVLVRRLTDPALWGREVTDERYLLRAQLR